MLLPLLFPVIIFTLACVQVLERIYSSNIRNYTIYHFESLGLLFAHFEYVGTNFEEDMAKIAQDQVTIEWWKECEPCQVCTLVLLDATPSL